MLQGKTLRCSLSETKHRLFIGNVPKGWTEDEFRRVVEEVGPGVETIELIKVDFLSPARASKLITRSDLLFVGDLP